MEYVFLQCNFVGCRQCHWRANYTGPKSLLQQAVVCAEVFIQSVPPHTLIQWCESGYHSGTLQSQIKFISKEIHQRYYNTTEIIHIWFPLDMCKWPSSIKMRTLKTHKKCYKRKELYKI